MRKKLLSLMLIVAFVVSSLAACGGSSDKAGNTGAADGEDAAEHEGNRQVAG